jgi:predicted metal-dependent phosphoesterase TrpH
VGRKFEFSVDMHVHSMYSGESLARPRDIIDAALEKGLDAIVITEHQSLHASAPFEKFRGQTPLTILRGVELTTDCGHMLVYGISDKDWNDWGSDRTVHAQDLIDRVNALGGIAVPAHPYVISGSKGSPYWWEPVVAVDERITGLHGLGAIEVCNGKHAGHPAVCEMLGAVARSMNLPGIGGSDAHMPGSVGCSYTAFKVPIYSNRDLVQAVKSGLLHPKNGTAVCPPVKSANISAR